jgi:PTH1 family peptidyl-tRNA hydrolase
MLVFAGLGNPGERYARNRHNIGFMAVDHIARVHGFEPWRGRFQGQVSEGRLGEAKVILLKPQTFMNRSGQSVGELCRFFKLDARSLTVFHDELDLAPGKVRVKEGGGHAGHNGLRDIEAHMGREFRRVRLGIGHPGSKDRVTPYVLSDFAKADQDWLQPVLNAVADAAPFLAGNAPEKFMTRVALLTQADNPSSED